MCEVHAWVLALTTCDLKPANIMISSNLVGGYF